MTTILFFDDWALHFRRDMIRCMGTPRWVSEATLEDDIRDGTWNYPIVFRDPDTGVWRGLYVGVTHVPSSAGQPKRRFLGLLLAESSDGIHWEKPDVSALTTTTVENRSRPNQVFNFFDQWSDGGPVFLDPVEKDPERRLKFLFGGYATDRPDLPRGQYLATSGDGIRWTLQPSMWGRRELDSPMTAFYNKHHSTYTIVCRPHLGDRRVSLIETPDFQNLEKPRIILHPDPLDPAMVQFYGMPVYPYEDMYIGLLMCLHTDPAEVRAHKILGYIDGHLTYSYDGRSFNRTYRQPFVARTPGGEPGSGCILPSCLLVDSDNRIRIYSGGSRFHHFQTTEGPDAALLLHTLRLDGFMYLQSDGGTGYIMTKPLRFTGPDLRINVSAPYGTVRVQLSELDGNPVTGLSFDECHPYRGDDLFYRPQWRSGLDPAAASGRLVRLEIAVTHGDLYAVRGDFQQQQGNGKP